MIEENIVTYDCKLESVHETDGKFLFTATSLDNNFECEKGRAILAKKSVGKPYIWRHQHPIQKGNEEIHIFGEIVASGINDKGFIESTYEIYGHTEDHLSLRKIIKDRQDIGEPLGVSMRYRKYFIGDKILHYDVFEHSGTPFPACNNCKNIKIGVENLTNEGDKTEEEKKLEDEFDFEESIKKIKELEEGLNSKTNILEDLQKQVDAYKKEIGTRDKELEEKLEKEKTLEDKILDLTKQVEYLGKKPIIDKILEVKDLDEKELEFYKTQEEDYLLEKYEDFKKQAESKIQVKDQDQTAEEAKDKSDEELSKKEPSFEEFTKFIRLKNKEKVEG